MSENYCEQRSIKRLLTKNVIDEEGGVTCTPIEVINEYERDGKTVYEIRMWRGLAGPSEATKEEVAKHIEQAKMILKDNVVPKVSWWSLNEHWVDQFFGELMKLSTIITMECDKDENIAANVGFEDKIFNEKRCRIIKPKGCKPQLAWDGGTIECEEDIKKFAICKISSELKEMLKRTTSKPDLIKT